MAVKIDVGGTEKRGDFFFVDPTKVIVREELRGRHTPPTDEQIIEMAESLMDHGQRQPVECRKLKDNRLQLNLGFTRTAAARLIRDGFTDSTGKHRQDENFTLKVILSDANDEQAFLNNVVENAHRNATSPVDDAHNQQRIRDQWGYSDAQITRLYRYRDENKVGRLKRLLLCPKAIQDAVHLHHLDPEKGMTVTTAIDLLDLPDDKRAEAIKAATDENGKVDTTKARSVVREHHLRDEEDAVRTGSGGKNGTPAKKAGTKPRVLREVRDFFKDEAENNQDENIKEFAKTVLMWIGGRRSDKTMHDALDKLLDAERG